MTIYCTYLTIYRGTKLPPFYIGFSSIQKIQRGYHGTVRSRQYETIWKEELIDNNHLFETHIISSHSSIQEAKSKESHIQRMLKVHKNPLYINMSINGEKFHTQGKLSCETKEKISSALRGKCKSEETRKRMSEVKIGENNPMYGRKISENHKAKISKANRGKSVNSGKKHPLYGKKHTEETKKKMRDSYWKKKTNLEL